MIEGGLCLSRDEEARPLTRRHGGTLATSHLDGGEAVEEPHFRDKEIELQKTKGHAASECRTWHESRLSTLSICKSVPKYRQGGKMVMVMVMEKATGQEPDAPPMYSAWAHAVHLMPYLF